MRDADRLRGEQGSNAGASKTVLLLYALTISTIFLDDGVQAAFGRELAVYLEPRALFLPSYLFS